MKEEFYNLLKSTKREGVDNVLVQLGKIGFFEAPASRKDHLGYPGGLMQHSLNVYRVAIALAEDLKILRPGLKLNKDSIIIASLLHDICKATRYKLNKEGKYEKNFSDFPAGHGEKSVIMLLQWGLSLTDDEILAIRWHMGPWQLALHNDEQTKDYVQAENTCPLMTLIHTADTLAAKIIEISKTDTDEQNKVTDILR